MIIPNLEKNFEHQYAEILQYVLANGQYTPNRTGVSTYVTQHAFICIENVLENFPIIKGKQMYPKMALKELMWFFNGRTDVQWLRDRGVKYWDEWEQPDGTIGKSYGHQYRNFGGVDNLSNVIKGIATNPLSRRHILNIWNPVDLAEMALEPCVYDYQFSCVPYGKEDNMLIDLVYGKIEANYHLDLHVTQRSCDMFLGVPYDLLIVGWMIQIIAELATNHPDSKITLRPRNIYYTLHDTHIYENHVAQCNQYLFNYNRSKDSLIEQKCLVEVPIYENPGIGDGVDIITLDQYLKISDDNKYKDFIIDKQYKDLYGPIKADVAV